ncbi:MAG: cytochrome ubiquinol oxidase subunit I [Mangrovicoccus sp.]
MLPETFSIGELQFAANLAFYALFPPLVLGLAWALVIMRLAYYVTKRPFWMRAFNLWVRIQALTFALAVLSSLSLTFQIAELWPEFTRFIRPISTPLLHYEVTAGFLPELCCLTIMLLAPGRVAGWMHGAATVLCALALSFSDYWLAVMTSWTADPRGVSVENGALILQDWRAVVQAPLLLQRLFEGAMIATVVTGGFLAGMSCFRLAIGRRDPEVGVAARLGLMMMTLSLPWLFYRAATWPSGIELQGASAMQTLSELGHIFVWSGSLILALTYATTIYGFRSPGKTRRLPLIIAWASLVILLGMFLVPLGFWAMRAAEQYPWLVKDLMPLDQARIGTTSTASPQTMGAYMAVSTAMMLGFVLTIRRLGLRRWTPTAEQRRSAAAAGADHRLRRLV